MIQTARATLQSFSASGRALFLFFAGLLVLSSVGLVYLLNQRLLVAVPAHGGSLVEGIIGAPRFINPTLAASDSDKDLSSLVYSGLLKASPEGGYIPDLAESYTVSPDGKTYTAVLKKGVTFQDGTPVTTDDVAFTIDKIQNPSLKSPLRQNWEGVGVAVDDARTIRFTLRQAYTPFIENLAVGILPKHLWEGVSDTDFAFNALNSNPVGSGPFKVSSVSRSSAGVPTSYTLTAFKQYALGWPYLDSLVFHLYQNQESLTQALHSGAIDAASGISPENLSTISGQHMLEAPESRIFGVFFNQNQSAVLRDASVRAALGDAIDKQTLIQSVLGGHGGAIDSPLPPRTLAQNSTNSAEEGASEHDRALAAQAELLKAGWALGADGTLAKTIGSGKSAKTATLSFSLATGNVPELKSAATYVQKAWEAMGAKVDLVVYDQGDLSQNVIRPRKYDALLFGEVVARQPDLFAFWHSSQRIDPGLNIALYTNPAVDTLLETLRSTGDSNVAAGLYTKLTTAIEKDAPAVFLYTPNFVYSVPKDIAGVNLGFIETPSDRFLSVHQWHRDTEWVWPIFAKRR